MKVRNFTSLFHCIQNKNVINKQMVYDYTLGIRAMYVLLMLYQ